MEDEVDEFHFKKYSEAELKNIDARLRIKFFRNKTQHDGSIQEVFDEAQYLRYVKAISADGSVLMDVSGRGEHGRDIYEFPTRYAKAMDMLDQWKNWMAKNEKVEKKIVAGLEETAAGMQIRDTMVSEVKNF